MAKQQSEVVEFAEVKPKTKNQHTLFKAVAENDLIICDGPAGTGKTLCAIGIACKMLFQGKINKILVSRTIVPCGDIGFLPGNEREKAEPYMMAHLEYFEKILGKNYKKYIAEGIIKLIPLETLRGTTFDNAVMILDEAQNVDKGQIKMFITRMGKDSKVIIIGDKTQADFKDIVGFNFCLNYLDKLDRVAIVKLTRDDILRNERIKYILEVFEKN